MAMYKDAEEIASVLEKYKNYIDIGEETSLFVAIIECVKAVIAAVPVVDAVEVVRCRNCVNYKSGVSIFGTCKRFDTNTLVNGYCSYGKKE